MYTINSPSDRFIEAAMMSGHAPYRAQQKYTELAGLLKLVNSIKPKKILELGVYKGGTIRSWTYIAASDALIIGVDLPHGEFGGGFTPEEALDIMKTLPQERQLIQLFALDSHLESTVKEVAQHGPFDFIFIDADHTYEGVKKDYEMYSKLVRKGGIIAFHDIVEHIHHPGVEVEKFWTELKQKNPGMKYYEFIDTEFPSDHNPWGGIAAIIVQ